MSDIAQRAQQFWSVLVFAAREQKILSYEMIGQMTGMAQSGVGSPLGHIAAYCMRNHLPPLNVLAIGKETGRPNPDFLHDVDLLSEQARVFVYDWISHGAPTVEELQEAYNWAKTTGKFKVVTP